MLAPIVGPAEAEGGGMLTRISLTIVAAALVAIGVALLKMSRDTVQETLFVELTEDGLTFHTPIHTNGMDLPVEGVVLYAATDDLTLSTFLLIKGVGAALLIGGLSLAGRQLPGLRDEPFPFDAVTAASLKLSLATLFASGGFRYWVRRREVGDALEALQVNPFGSLDEAGKEIISGAVTGELMGAFREQLIGRALAAGTPVRAWSRIMAVAFLVLAAWTAWSAFAGLAS